MKNTIIAAAIALLALPAFSADESKPVDPSGWEASAAPVVGGFETEEVMSGVRKLLRLDAAKEVALMPMNSKAPKDALPYIMEGLVELSQAGVPAACLARDVRFAVDALTRTLDSNPKAKLDGMDIVIVSPEAPARRFTKKLTKRGIHIHWLKVVIKE